MGICFQMAFTVMGWMFSVGILKKNTLILFLCCFVDLRQCPCYAYDFLNNITKLYLVGEDHQFVFLDTNEYKTPISGLLSNNFNNCKLCSNSNLELIDLDVSSVAIAAKLAL